MVNRRRRRKKGRNLAFLELMLYKYNIINIFCRLHA